MYLNEIKIIGFVGQDAELKSLQKQERTRLLRCGNEGVLLGTVSDAMRRKVVLPKSIPIDLNCMAMILRLRYAPDENVFALSTNRRDGCKIRAVLEVKKEIRV